MPGSVTQLIRSRHLFRIVCRTFQEERLAFRAHIKISDVGDDAELVVPFGTEEFF